MQARNVFDVQGATGELFPAPIRVKPFIQPGLVRLTPSLHVGVAVNGHMTLESDFAVKFSAVSEARQIYPSKAGRPSGSAKYDFGPVESVDGRSKVSYASAKDNLRIGIELEMTMDIAFDSSGKTASRQKIISGTEVYVGITADGKCATFTGGSTKSYASLLTVSGSFPPWLGDDLTTQTLGSVDGPVELLKECYDSNSGKQLSNQKISDPHMHWACIIPSTVRMEL